MLKALPINLRRYRTIRRLRQQDVAEAVGISRSSYRNLETGQSEPEWRVIENLAEFLEVDAMDLLEDVPVPKSVRFRSKQLTAQERAERDQLIVETQRWLNDYRELEELLDVSRECKLIDICHGKADPIDCAAVARERLGFAKEFCVGNVAEELEEAGIRIRAFETRSNRLNGFSLAAVDGGPAMAINCHPSIPVERQIFSAAHELGHLIMHRASYEAEVHEAEIASQENEANLFAAHFLMPADKFDEVWSRYRGLPWIQRLIKTKRTFHVSWMTVARRLIDKQIADQTIYVKFKKVYELEFGVKVNATEEPDTIGNAPWQLTAEPDRLDRFDFLADRFCRLVRDAVEKELISFDRAAEMLGKSLTEVRELVDNWRLFP